MPTTILPKGGLPYGVLNQTNPDYMGDLWAEVDDLYRGGYKIERVAHKYIRQLKGETQAQYDNRLKSIGYINYLGQIVDYFAAALFEEPIVVTPAADADDDESIGGEAKDDDYYTTFAHDVDLKGMPFQRLLKCAFTTAILKKKAFVHIDFPLSDVKPVNRAEEEKLGTSRAYAFETDVEEVIDWEYNDNDVTTVEVGNEGLKQKVFGLSYVVLKRTITRRASPEARRGTHVIEFKIWRLDEKTGSVTWEIYRTPPIKKGDILKDDDVVALVVEPQETTFKRIPLVELVIPDGLWVGNKIGPLAREHYQRRSMLVSSENRSLLAIGYVKLGAQVSAPGQPVYADIAQDQNRGDDPAAKAAAKGFMVLAEGDEIGYAEPTGGAFIVVDNQLAGLKDEMFRTVHQMAASVDNSSSSMRRSGASKMEDRAAESTVLTAYGDLVRDFAKRIYTALSESREDAVVWTPHGLDDFEQPDRAQLLAEAVQEDTVNFPSPTYKKIRKTQLALSMLGSVEPSTKLLIQKEIEAGVDQEIQMAKVVRDAELTSVKQGFAGEKVANEAEDEEEIVE